MPTQNDRTIERVAALEAELPPIKATMSRLEKNLYPLNWKSITIIASIVVGVAVAYAQFYVPSQIDNRILTKLTGDQAPAVKKELVDSLGLLEAKINRDTQRLEQRLDNQTQRIDDITRRIDGFLSSMAKTREGTGRGYAHAVSAKVSKLKNSLPVARELLERAKQQSTVLSHREIRRLARMTLPLLDKENKDTELRKEVWSTVVELAEYKSFVDSKLYSTPAASNTGCRNGVADLGGIPLQDQTFVNCRVSYRGGDIMLSNVQYLNCEFDVIDEPEGRRFVTAMILSDKPVINFGTSPKSVPKTASD
jgi:hypothetical protein